MGIEGGFDEPSGKPSLLERLDERDEEFRIPSWLGPI